MVFFGKANLSLALDRALKPDPGLDRLLMG
jgi:hypothetical protein